MRYVMPSGLVPHSSALTGIFLLETKSNNINDCDANIGSTRRHAQQIQR